MHLLQYYSMRPNIFFCLTHFLSVKWLGSFIKFHHYYIIFIKYCFPFVWIKCQTFKNIFFFCILQCRMDYVCLVVALFCALIYAAATAKSDPSTTIQCKISEWMCSNGTCISASKFCDGHPDCMDRTDEPNHCTGKLLNYFISVCRHCFFFSISLIMM